MKIPSLQRVLERLLSQKVYSKIENIQLVSDLLLQGKGIRRFEATNDELSALKNSPHQEMSVTASFLKPDKRLVHKWHHYLPIYEEHFSPYKTRSEPVRLLEIGVSGGGSLRMWRDYFGDDAKIYGIDVNSACLEFSGLHGEVRIGSQDDPYFLADVIEEMGGVDIVVDDGSHIMAHIKKSLVTLFPLLEQGGLYFIEDLHTSYWRGHGGGFYRKANFFNLVRSLIDDMHHWYHSKGKTLPEISDELPAMHIYDSICILEKRQVSRPRHSSLVHQ